MANTADKVIDIALAEVGYLEKSASAYKQYGKNCLYDKTKYAGEDNYTKYGYEMHQIYPSVMDFPAYWCDCFVDWCFYKAYGTATAKSLLGGNFDDYTKGSISLYQSKDAFFTRGQKTPAKGDQVFFTKNKTLNGVHHTGLVYAVDASNIYTVEGNTSNGTAVVPNGGGVCKKQYPINDARIYGYGRPKYDASSTPIAKLDEIKITCGKDGLIIVGASSLNIRNTPNGNVVGSLKQGQKTQVIAKVKANSSDNYYWFKIKDNQYISGQYVQGWIKEANNHWWYVTQGYKYPASVVKTIDNKDYAFDKEGWMITSDRIQADGSIKGI